LGVVRVVVLSPAHTLQPLRLQLLDIPLSVPMVAGVVMELLDCSFPLLESVTHTGVPDEAFRYCDAAILASLHSQWWLQTCKLCFTLSLRTAC
jgi:hypothetical protein